MERLLNTLVAADHLMVVAQADHLMVVTQVGVVVAHMVEAGVTGHPPLVGAQVVHTDLVCIVSLHVVVHLCIENWPILGGFRRISRLPAFYLLNPSHNFPWICALHF